MTRFIILVCILMAIVVSSGKASSEFFYNEMLPSGVVFGMTSEQLAQARPEARTHDLVQSRGAQANEAGSMVEFIRQGNGATVYWYRFKDGKLGSVSRSISTKNLPPESAQSEARRVYGELLENFSLNGQADVVRLTGGKGFFFR